MNVLQLALALATVSLVATGCGSRDEASGPATDTTATVESVIAAPEPVSVRIVVRDGQPVGGIARPEVDEGEQVVLVVESDVAGDVHLHGYDLERPVEPGSPARIRFRATIPGRFAIELHAHPELHIGELTVEP